MFLKALNASFIALIPKQENAMTPDGFRPITLCNVVYKIISKVIANRLKPLLPSLISEEQTGYVEGRQILKNIIQAHEVVHSLKSNKQSGNLARFWEDNWKQESILYKDGLAALKRDTNNKGLTMVKYFWNQDGDNEKWRNWKDLGYNDDSTLKALARTLAQELEHRRILVSSLPDQLRWGKNPEGNFNLKEAKQEVT
eukprot:PITA_07996